MTNPGPSPVTVLGVTVVDDAAGVFALAVTTPFTVGPGETTIIEIVITAPDVGTFTARLVFDVGDPAIAIGATLTVRGSWWRVVDGVATASPPAGTSWDGTVRSTATGIQLVRVVQGKEVVDAAPTAGVRAVHVGGTDGDDRLVLDLLTPLLIPLSVDGGAGADTLVGPNSDTTWAVIGPDKGSVSGLSFAGVENLTGAANNHDTFEFAAAGVVSGTVRGGDGGFDTIHLTGGTFARVIYDASGAGFGHDHPRRPDDRLRRDGTNRRRHGRRQPGLHRHHHRGPGPPRARSCDPGSSSSRATTTWQPSKA